MVLSRRYLETFILFLAVICLRGTFISEIGFNATLPIFFMGIYVLLKKEIFLEKNLSFLFVFMVMVCYFFSTLNSLIQAPGLSVILFKNHITFFIPLLLFIFIAGDSYQLKLVFKIIIILNSVIAGSCLITLVLFYVGKLSFEMLSIYYDYYIPAKIYFPFSILYGSPFKTPVLFFPRLLSIYRESGIAQIMIFFCFIQVDQLFAKAKRLIKVMLILGVALTLSTAGLITIVFMFIHWFLSNRGWRASKTQLIVFLLCSLIGFVGFYLIPGVGLKDKMGGRSYEYRFGTQDKAMELVKESPIFGTGYRNRLNKPIPETNFLISLYQLGIPLWVFLALVYLIPLIQFKYNRLRLITELSPIYLSLLFAQPLYFQPLFVFYFANLINDYTLRDARRY